jgi:hypothetical protein
MPDLLESGADGSGMSRSSHARREAWQLLSNVGGVIGEGGIG